MDFGKIALVDEVDFSLPAIPTRTKESLGNHQPTQLKVHLGATGWGMKGWVGTYYPPGTKSADFLKAYSAQFNTIELNTTHYRIPDFTTIDKWKAAANPDFRFCPKLPQSISHRNDLGMVSGQLDAFINSISALDAKLGPCFMQLPPYFAPDRLSILKNFILAWPTELRLAIEFRHPDWFSEDQATQLYELFRESSIVKLITDVAGRRDVLHQDICQPFCLVRFVGNDFHPSDYRRLDDWITRILKLQQLGLQELYFFCHQPDNVRAPEVIQYLLSSLITNSSIAVKQMLPNFNSQLPLF